MAIAKVILNGEVQMDVTSDTVEANKLLSGETATKNDGTKVTGTYIPPDPVISSLTVTPTESAQTFDAAGVSGYKPVTVNAIPSSYIIPSGTYSVTENGTYDVGSYASVDVSVSGGGGGLTPDDIALRNISGSIIGSANSIGSYAFASCSNLSTASFPVCTTISTSAFAFCSNLGTVSFPSCTTIGDSAFACCYNLGTASFPVCKTLSIGAFAFCSNLSTASFPSCTTIGDSAFACCSNLGTVSFPVCKTLSTGAFAFCSNLSTASFPSCTTIGTGVFSRCSNLSTASFPVCKTIGNGVFGRCSNLFSLYLLGSSLAKLTNKNAFYSTPISDYTTYTDGVHGSIFVPASLYNSYISATNWSYYSARIVGLTDEQMDPIIH